ncbi:hypothetical protein CMI37_32235 [Candidatus Pacearchaeota archaeon]|nr:hypothetical protein [Candidatus Pacearchaeota archaeon]|tara:strand:+ start:3920 stop:4216 length:297 start_codon:yes stop_codon:yes gene_type:complete
MAKSHKQREIDKKRAKARASDKRANRAKFLAKNATKVFLSGVSTKEQEKLTSDAKKTGFKPSGKGGAFRVFHEAGEAARHLRTPRISAKQKRQEAGLE